MKISIINNQIGRENLGRKLKSNNCLTTFITLPTLKKSSMRDFKQILTLTNKGVSELNINKLNIITDEFNSSANITWIKP